MCGISCIYNFDDRLVDKSNLNRMLKILKHRGPDDEGVFIDENIGLGHVRLSIIDTSRKGHQPMFGLEDRYSIIFNGEIYNHLELRNILKDKYVFNSNCDTEVIIAAYHVWGEECLNKFNGDWAFVLYDKKTGNVFGSRDRFGIKPLYYFKNNEHLLISSEIKAILPFVESKPNNKIIFDYLAFNRTDHYEDTFFENIKKISPGHSFSIIKNEFKIKKWYEITENLKSPFKSHSEFRKALRKSIKLRLRSDVPVGLSLSGGIDSSSITSIVIDDLEKTKINTFSAIYKNTNEDESEFINEYSCKVKNMHFTEPNATSFFNEFKDFIASQGEPVASIGPYAQYKVMQKASGKIVVSLDGQGADEQLAGYHYFFGSYFKELLSRLRFFSFIFESTCYLIKHRSLLAFKYLLFYSLSSSHQKKLGGKIIGTMNKNFYLKYSINSTIANDFLKPKNLNDSLVQHFKYKLQHLLKWGDINSMRFSIESRVPFLDHNIVEKTLPAKPSHKIYAGETKYILRKSLKDILPKKIYLRKDKKGFSTPSDKWFRDEQFKTYIRKMLNSDEFSKREYFDVEKCKILFEKHLSGKINISKEIWKWINLEEWSKIYID